MTEINDTISVDLLEKQLIKKLAQDIGIVDELVEFWGPELWNQTAAKLESSYQVVEVIEEE